MTNLNVEIEKINKELEEKRELLKKVRNNKAYDFIWYRINDLEKTLKEITK